MADTKQDILEMLRELAELTLLDEANPQAFRVRAYESAAQAIAAQATDLGRLSHAELQAIQGIGKSTADKIRELIDTGRVDKLERLRAKYPRSLVALLRIPGLGPKALLRLRAELEVESLDDLRRALGEHKLRELKGFGAKSEQKLALAIERLSRESSLERTPIAIALPLAERIVSALQAVPGVRHASYCGSLRRFCETIGDIDIVVAASEPARVMDAFVAHGAVDQVLVRGETKTSVLTGRGLQLDLRVVTEQQLGAALLYFTGSKGHNIKLRQRALARGLTLNEYALSRIDSGERVAGASEAEIYAALDLPFIPPVLREDTGEIEAAEQGRLPLPLGNIRGDFHVHTSVSKDGRATLDEMVGAALARGTRVLAITDHAEGTLPGALREALLDQRDQIRALAPSLTDKLCLLHGVELNIDRDGRLDYDPTFRAAFDFCLASVHDHFGLDRATQTRRVLRAIEDPSVRMLGHLTARMIGTRPPIELDLDQIFASAAAHGTALEINGGLPRLDLSVDALRRASGYAVQFVLTSDAHRVDELDRVRFAALNAERAWLAPERVVNTWEPERLAAWARGA